MKSPLRLVIRVMPLLAIFLLSALQGCGLGKGPRQGFRDLKWGDPPPAGMVKDKYGFYHRPSDNMSIEGVPVSAIFPYYFFENQFYAVEISCEDGPALAKVLVEEWGKPKETGHDGHALSYSWTKGDTAALLEIPVSTNSGELSIYSISLKKAAVTAKNAKAPNTKGDL